MGLVQASFFNNTNKNIAEEKDADLFNSPDINISVSKRAMEGLKIDSTTELNKKAEIVNTKIELMRKELNSNLRHLEFILTIENQLANLASKDKYTLERLQKYVKVKMDVQLKIIQLSQSISNDQSKKINLC
tara:strand:- start:2357 stop:2752 length:396 start_codon:yes stop_codon:yes gene_type:complete